MEKKLMSLKQWFRIKKEEAALMSDIDRSRRNLLTYTCFANVTGNLIGGSFLTGLLLYLNATTVQLGLLNIIAYICNLLQLFAPLLLEKFQHRKKILISMLVIIRVGNIVCMSVASLLPVSGQIRVYIILIFNAVINLANALWSPGASIWHIQSIPEQTRSSYFGLQQRLTNVCVYVALLAASAFTDFMKGIDRELGGYLVLRIIAALVCIGEVFFLTKVKEFPYQKGEPIHLKSVFVEPFKHKRYLISILILFLWNFVANTVSSYFTVYMLDTVQIGYTFLNLMGALYVPIVLVMMPFWTRSARKHSWFNLSWKALIGYGFFTAAFFLIRKETIWLYPFFQIGANIFAVGINLSFASLPYYNMPRENQTVFMAFYAAVVNFAALLGTTYATRFASAYENHIFHLFGMQVMTGQFMQMVTGILISLCGLVVLFLDVHERKRYGIITGA